MSDLKVIMEDLTKLESEISSAEREKSQFEGKRDQLYSNLKRDLDIDSKEKAQAELMKFEQDLKEIIEKINTNYKSLKENYEW